MLMHARMPSDNPGSSKCLPGYLQIGCELIKRNPKCKNESFNFGPESNVNKTVDQVLVEMSESWSNVSWEVEPLNSHYKEAGLLKLCCDKAHHTINWFPTLTFEETIEFTMSWYREFYNQPETFGKSQFTQNQISSYIEKAKYKSLEWTKNRH